ncbi:MAG TPA: sigma-54 dependent transcriptional regulator [Verrucomicrobiae bacterium]|jgi:DNA-binding NtrC family response regulator
MKSKILVVDDENDLRQLLAAVLGEHYEVSQAGSGAALKKLFPQPAPDVVLLDVKLPDADGLDLLTQIKRRWPDTEVILLSGYGTMSMAIEAGRRGAYTFLTKPFENEKLLADVKCAIERKEQSAENLTLRRALETMSGTASPIFKSPAMQDVVRTVERVAPSDVTVLITGESGSGKEVIADLLHTLSPRNKNKIIKINCAALPRELIESELFGSVKGAFTGAHSDREGLFRQAEGGTLFLDEISEMPADTQSKLLRVLQDQEVRPVGGKTTYKTNCRIVAATNREPQGAIKEGKLREDLFYRISAISVHLPPLRERRDDIMPLAGVFLKRFAAQANRDIQGFNQEAIGRLTDFDWPGNVRQLQNEIQRAVLLCEGMEIDVADLSISNTKPVSEMAEETDSGYTLLESVERNTIVQTLKASEGNKLEAAKRLGIGRQTLYNKLKAYGIEV